ncbi:hypothetical protein B0H11DRAFT_1929025 [Mycena galericulata]|nr:hypothetical protein B0H11DRAFT_1929025 [Mycena galericulata]
MNQGSQGGTRINLSSGYQADKQGRVHNEPRNAGKRTGTKQTRKAWKRTVQSRPSGIQSFKETTCQGVSACSIHLQVVSYGLLLLVAYPGIQLAKEDREAHESAYIHTVWTWMLYSAFQEGKLVGERRNSGSNARVWMPGVWQSTRETNTRHLFASGVHSLYSTHRRTLTLGEERRASGGDAARRGAAADVKPRASPPAARAGKDVGMSGMQSKLGYAENAEDWMEESREDGGMRWMSGTRWMRERENGKRERKREG